MTRKDRYSSFMIKAKAEVFTVNFATVNFIPIAQTTHEAERVSCMILPNLNKRRNVAIFNQ